MTNRKSNFLPDRSEEMIEEFGAREHLVELTVRSENVTSLFGQKNLWLI